MNLRCGYPRKSTMSMEQVSWRRDANELMILARIEAYQISNRLNLMPSSFAKRLSLGVYIRRYNSGTIKKSTL